jgi:HEAT repeat protein
MRYSTILVLMVLMGLFSYGCICGGGNPTPVPTESGASSSSVSSEASSVSSETSSISSETSGGALEIPIAQNIDPALKTSVDELISTITGSGDDWEAANKAGEKLNKMIEEQKNNVPFFAYLAQNSNPDISRDGIDGLDDCDDPNKAADVIDVLICAVKHPCDHVRSDVFWNLAMGDKTDEQKEKVKEVGRIGLDDPSGLARANAVNLVGSLDDDKSIDKLKEMMNNDKAPQVVAAAIQALDRMNVDVKEDLMKILDTGTPYVKCYAINVLATKKDKDLLPKLVPMLDDKTETWFSVDFDDKTPMSYNTYAPTIREMAVKGFESMTGETFKGAKDDDVDGVVKKWKAWAKKNVK